MELYQLSRRKPWKGLLTGGCGYTRDRSFLCTGTSKHWLLLLFSHQVVSNSATSWTATCQASLSLTISWSLPKSMSIESVMLSNNLIIYFFLLLPSIFPSIRVFSNKSAVSIRWPKYWSFSFSVSLPKSIQGWFPLRLTGLISLLSKGPSRVFSNTTVKYHFFSTLPSLLSSSHICTWLLEKL